MLPNYLDEYNAIRSEIKGLSNQIIETYKLQLDAFMQNDFAKLDATKKMLKSVDGAANDIDNRIIKVLARFEPEAGILRELVAFLKTTNELSRVAAAGKKYVFNMKIQMEEKVSFADGITDYLILMHKAAIKAMEYATRLDDDADAYEEDYKKTMIEESKTDDLYIVLEKEILSTMCHGEEINVKSMRILNIARKFERVADHAANIAKMYLYAKKGGSMEVF